MMIWRLIFAIVVISSHIHHVTSSNWISLLKEDIKRSLKQEILEELQSELKAAINEEIKQLVSDFTREPSEETNAEDNIKNSNHDINSVSDSLKLFIKSEIRKDLKLIFGERNDYATVKYGQKRRDESATNATQKLRKLRTNFIKKEEQRLSAIKHPLLVKHNDKNGLTSHRAPSFVVAGPSRHDDRSAHKFVAGGGRNDRAAGSVFKSTAGRGRNVNGRAAGSVSRRRSSGPQSVAFTAYLDHPYAAVGAQTVIKFNRALLNDGNGYNVYTGVFTAPVDGVYLFSFQYSTSAGQVSLQLLLDGQQTVSSVNGHLSGSNSAESSALAILRVTAGQSVWVETFGNHQHTIDGHPVNRQTSFAGALLYY